MAIDPDRGTLGLDDEDRLPWLEPAFDDEEEETVSMGRLVGFIVAGLVLLGLVVGGIYLLRDAMSSDSEGEFIPAPKGSYKIAAKDADARKFEGEGDTSFAASEGIDRDGRIDPSRLPEAPISNNAGLASAGGRPGVPSAAAPTVSAKVADRTGDKGATPASPAAARPPSGTIQLGAYGSNAIAQDAWKRLSSRFDYLADLSHSVEPVVVGGTQFFRLRAVVGANAGTVCGKLKVAGENCLVVG